MVDIPEAWKSDVVVCYSQHIADAWAKAYGIVWTASEMPDTSALDRVQPGTATAPRTLARRDATMVQSEWRTVLWAFRVLDALGVPKIVLDDSELGLSVLRVFPISYENDTARSVIERANTDDDFREYLLGVIALGADDDQIAEAALRRRR